MDFLFALFFNRMFLFIFLLPAAQAILFCLAIGRDPSFLKMAIVNDELDPSQGRICNYTTDCTYSMFSCRYLRFIDNTTIVQVSYFPFVLILNKATMTSLLIYVCIVGSIQKFNGRQRGDETGRSVGRGAFWAEFHGRVGGSSSGWQSCGQ